MNPSTSLYRVPKGVSSARTAILVSRGICRFPLSKEKEPTLYRAPAWRTCACSAWTCFWILSRAVRLWRACATGPYRENLMSTLQLRLSNLGKEESRPGWDTLILQTALTKNGILISLCLVPCLSIWSHLRHGRDGYYFLIPKTLRTEINLRTKSFNGQVELINPQIIYISQIRHGAPMMGKTTC